MYAHLCRCRWHCCPFADFGISLWALAPAHIGSGHGAHVRGVSLLFIQLYCFLMLTRNQIQTAQTHTHTHNYLMEIVLKRWKCSWCQDLVLNRTLFRWMLLSLFLPDYRFHFFHTAIDADDDVETNERTKKKEASAYVLFHLHLVYANR